MTEEQIKRILEAALFAAGEPLNIDRLSKLFAEDERPANLKIRELLNQLMDESEGRGYELKEVASGFRYQVDQELSPWVGRLWEEKPQRYSRALLETLALIAYRQPVTRGEIEDVRGVAVSSNIIRTLLEREWVRVVGHRDVPGRPAMYATTKNFLDYFNLKTLGELPTLAEIKDLDKLNEELALADPDAVNQQDNLEQNENQGEQESQEQQAEQDTLVNQETDLEDLTDADTESPVELEDTAVKEPTSETEEFPSHS